MKKIYLLAAMLISGATMAQGVKFGIKAGANFANNTMTSGGMTITPSSITSFHAGAFLTAGFSKFAIQPEVLISSQGFKTDGGKESTLYLNVPLMVKYNVVGGLSLEAGPQVGLLLSAQTKPTNDVSFDNKDNYKSLDLGANLGAEYVLPVGLLFNARYTYGLANLAKDQQDFSYKNKVFSLGVGYRF